MKKKHAPEQYTAKPKPVVVIPIVTTTEHPAVAVAKKLVSWLDRGGIPPSIILLHGLHIARSRENDGLPIDTIRPHIQMQGNDNRSISEVMDALARPQVVKTQVIATWLQFNWVKKSVNRPQPSLTQKKPPKPTAAKKVTKPSNSGRSSTKPAVTVKNKKR